MHFCRRFAVVSPDLLSIKLVVRPKADMQMSFLPHDSVEIEPCQSREGRLFSVSLYTRHMHLLQGPPRFLKKMGFSHGNNGNKFQNDRKISKTILRNIKLKHSMFRGSGEILFSRGGHRSCCEDKRK